MKLKILIAVVVSAMVVGGVIFYHSDFGHGTRDEKKTPWGLAGKFDSSAGWEIFRGDAGMAGVADGKLGRKFRLYHRIDIDPMAGFATTPVYRDGKIYFANDMGKVFCFDLETGQEMWQLTLEDICDFAPPLIVGDSVIVGGYLEDIYCLSAADGTVRWRYEIGGGVENSANIATVNGQKLVIAAGFHGDIAALSLDDGREVWLNQSESDPHAKRDAEKGKPQPAQRFKRSLNSTSEPADDDLGRYILAAPAVAGGQVLVGSCRAGIVQALSIDDGSVTWEVILDGYLPNTVAADGGDAFVSDMSGNFFRINIANGKIVWKRFFCNGDGNGDNDDANGNGDITVWCSAAVDETRVIFGDGDGRIRCLNRDDGKDIWTYNARGSIQGSPVICDGKVAFGCDEGWVYLLSLADGKKIWSYELGLPAGPPAVIGGLIIIGCDDGTLYIFGPD